VGRKKKSKIGHNVLKGGKKLGEAVLPEETVGKTIEGIHYDINELSKAIKSLARGKIEITSMEILPDKTIKLFVKGARKDIDEFAKSLSSEITGNVIGGLIVLGVTIVFVPHMAGAILKLKVL